MRLDEPVIRGVCRICGQAKMIRGDGRIARHLNPRGAVSLWCKGTGLVPVYSFPKGGLNG